MFEAVTIAALVAMPALVIFNQATVWGASGWRYRWAVIAGLLGLFGIPLGLLAWALLDPSYSAFLTAGRDD